MADIESLGVVGTTELIAEYQRGLDSEIVIYDDVGYSSLASHIRSEFIRARDVRRSSGIEESMFDSLRYFNGEYNPKDLQMIREEGGSNIFMNLTATKCRAAASWIKDILLGKVDPFSIEPTPQPSLPEDILTLIERAIKQETAVSQAPQEGGMSASKAQETLTESNQKTRDIKDAIYQEIFSEAKYGVKQIEVMIKDQLVEGSWECAFSDFIDDFVVFPSAIMKGPIITKKKRLTWLDGLPNVVNETIFLNKRVSPFDIYPLPETTNPNNGGIIEHLRLSPSELYGLKDLVEAGYKTEAIEEILGNLNNNSSIIPSDVDTSVESEKDEQELTGSSFEKKNLLHGLHYFGPIPAKLLQEWGLDKPEVMNASKYETLDVEAILIGNVVIKCVINDDPLGRRPYYVASWQNRPGSFWGRSLPSLMSDIQRMCNAAARALANNMGLASGPQIEIYVDRLADDAPLDSIRPFKVWQFTSDPTGAGGRALQFNQPTSNARELLEVYNEYEMKADEATGIPRYMYGSEQVSGAGQTAAGLSMLLDAATKTIKEAIRHIDLGLIQPRIEYQFYYNMIKNPIPNFSTDVQIIAKGSQTLSVKGAAQLRRNEFLQITANPFDMGILGKQGRADILREIAKDLDLASDIIPNRLIIKKLGEEEAMAQQQAMEMERERGLEATRIQIEGQMAMAQGAQEVKMQQIQLDYEKESAKLQLAMQKIQQQQDEVVGRLQVQVQNLQQELSQRDIENKRNVAAKLEIANRGS